MLNVLPGWPGLWSNWEISKEGSILPDKSRINLYWLTLRLFVRTWSNIWKRLRSTKRHKISKKQPLSTCTWKCSSRLLLLWRKSSPRPFWSNMERQRKAREPIKRQSRLMKMLRPGRMWSESTWLTSITLKNPNKSWEVNAQHQQLLQSLPITARNEVSGERLWNLWLWPTAKRKLSWWLRQDQRWTSTPNFSGSARLKKECRLQYTTRARLCGTRLQDSTNWQTISLNPWSCTSKLGKLS